MMVQLHKDGEDNPPERGLVGRLYDLPAHAAWVMPETVFEAISFMIGLSILVIQILGFFNKLK